MIGIGGDWVEASRWSGVAVRNCNEADGAWTAAGGGAGPTFGGEELAKNAK